MKTYNKTSLPDSIEYNGETYKMNPRISRGMNASGTSPNVINATLKKEGRKGVLVNVLSRELRGKTDLDGQPYKPTRWIYTNK